MFETYKIMESWIKENWKWFGIYMIISFLIYFIGKLIDPSFSPTQWIH